MCVNGAAGIIRQCLYASSSFRDTDTLSLNGRIDRISSVSVAASPEENLSQFLGLVSRSLARSGSVPQRNA